MSDEKNKNPGSNNSEPKKTGSRSFVGKFVSMTGDKLVMANSDGKQHSHAVSSDTNLMCDGSTCKAADFMAGSRLRITTLGHDRNVVTDIETLNKNSEFTRRS
jgi:hypothetical protein